MMNIKRFENSVFGSNSYVIDDGYSAVIFDIGDIPPIFDYLEKSALTPDTPFMSLTRLV